MRFCIPEALPVPMSITSHILAAFLISSLFFATMLPGGDLTNRLELTLQRVLDGGPPHYTEDFLLADVIPRDVRRFTNFSGDLSGRYIGALSRLSPHQTEAARRLEPLVAAVLQHQRADGHFGEPLGGTEIRGDDMARLWGNGRLLIGLLEYYRENPQPQILEAARRLGDFLVSVAPQFNAPSVRRYFSDGRFAVGYICWTQTLEALVELYRQTSDERYLGLAAQLAERVERLPSQHSHGFLTTLRGVLELGRATGDQRYLQQVEREWQAIVDSGNLLVQGAIPEAFKPSVERDEGCSESDWLRLNLELWKETGNLTYLEHAERTLFNEFFFNQFAGGDFGHVALRESGVGPSAARAWWCCTLHGLRAFPEVFDSVFRVFGETLFYDLPVDGEGRFEDLSVIADSSLERNARVRIEIETPNGKPLQIAIRVPPWAGSVAVRAGAEAVPGQAEGGFFVLQRPLKSGDVIEIEYELLIRLEHHRSQPGYLAVFHGPWLLAVTENTSPHFFDEPWEHNRVVLGNPAKTDQITPSPQKEPDADLQEFQIPVAHHEFEWIPAGYPAQRQKSMLRPLAEATGSQDSTRWEFWLRSGDAETPADPSNAPVDHTPLSPVTLSLLAFVAAFGAALAWRRLRSR